MLHDFDVNVVNFINQFVGQSLVFDDIVVASTELNLFRGVFIMCLICWVYFNRFQTIIDPSLYWPRVGLGTILAIAISRIMQNNFPMRLRPRHEPGLDFVLPKGVQDSSLQDWSSFPSDHAVMFGALALATFFLDRRFGLIAIVWTIVIVLLPRIYIGAHYPSDLIVGAAIGAFIMTSVWLLPAPLYVHKKLLHLEDRHRGFVVAVLFLFLYFCSTMFGDARFIVYRLPGLLEDLR